MRILRSSLSLVLLLSPARIWAAGSGLPQLPAEQVVARVNGVELRGRELNDYLDVFVPNVSVHGKVQLEKINVYRRQALERMVLHELIYQDAVRRGFHPPASEVESELVAMRNRFRFREAFEHALASRGLTLDNLRTQIRHNLTVAAVVRQDITTRAQVTEAEARSYYRQNLQQFRQPESVQVRHIFLSLGAESEKQAGEIRRLAAAKNTAEEFDQLARRFSKDDYRVIGGMLGTVHRGRLEPALEDAAFALSPGELSPVIKTPTGFHLLRVEAKQPERLVPLQEVQDKIRKELQESKTKRLRDELRSRVYKNAKVELLAEF